MVDLSSPFTAILHILVESVLFNFHIPLTSSINDDLYLYLHNVFMVTQNYTFNQ